jgi:arylsulfatase A-like enzyme
MAVAIYGGVIVESPNIVLVVMDTARALNMPMYGYGRDTTPFLSNLAEENVFYEDVFSQANWTMPSHASMFSGQYNTEHRIIAHNDFSRIDHFGDKLKEEGYSRYAVTNIGFLSEEFGFDDIFDDLRHRGGESLFDGLDIDRQDFYDREGFIKYLEFMKEFSLNITREKVFLLFDRLKDRLLLTDSGANWTNKEALDQLEEHDDDEPFFMYLNYKEAHLEYKPPLPYSHMFLDEKFCWNKILELSRKEFRHWMSEERSIDFDVIDFRKDLYDGELRYLDGKLEHMYQTITEKYPDTVFIFTSDHGEYFGEHGNLQHFVGLHDEVTKVPMIEVFPDGRESEEEDVRELRQLESHILNLSKDERKIIEGREAAFSEDLGAVEEEKESYSLTDKDMEIFSRYRIAARSKGARLIWYSDEQKKLYDANSNEIQDSDKMEQLSNLINSNFGNPEKQDYDKKDIDADDEEIKEELEKLGYI